MVMIIDMTNGEVEEESIVFSVKADKAEKAELQCPQSDWREPGLALVEVSLETPAETFPAELQDVDMAEFVETMEQSAGR